MTHGNGPGGVLIFGAYGGVGSALARRLRNEGFELALSGRDQAKLGALAAEVDALPLCVEATSAAVSRAVEHFGSIAGVANCAGSLMLKPAHATRSNEFLATIAANLTTSFSILRSVVRPMMKGKHGSIVFVSTAAAAHGLPNHEAIAAAKGGVDALVRSAAATYGKSGIRVNAVAPGLVETPLTARITSSDAARSASEAMHALGRIGTADEVAGAIAWLLSEEASWVTGQTLGVDGGLSSVRSA